MSTLQSFTFNRNVLQQLCRQFVMLWPSAVAQLLQCAHSHGVTLPVREGIAQNRRERERKV
jgi:hypothetical protein